MTTGIDQRIADRDALLRILIGGNRYATAAMDRGDDLALLRIIAKSDSIDLLQAKPIAADRASMRGHPRRHIAKALGMTAEEVRLLTLPIWRLATGQESGGSR